MRTIIQHQCSKAIRKGITKLMCRLQILRNLLKTIFPNAFKEYHLVLHLSPPILKKILVRIFIHEIAKFGVNCIVCEYIFVSMAVGAFWPRLFPFFSALKIVNIYVLAFLHTIFHSICTWIWIKYRIER